MRVAGLVIARQRPATAKGVTFMLLEDELGTINLIVSPPVHDRFRLAVRSEPLVLASGRLERREGTANVIVDRIERLDRPGPAERPGEAHRAAASVVERRRRAQRGRAQGTQLRQARLSYFDWFCFFSQSPSCWPASLIEVPACWNAAAMRSP